MSERVLVTGGAGFIGSHLSAALLSEGYRVRILDDLSVGRIENVPEGCEFLQGSITDDAAVERATSDVLHICHEAARVTIRGSVESFCEDAEANLMGTLRLLRWAGKRRIRRFIYASSMAVYADAPEPSAVPESHRLEPASPYGIAKLAAERYVQLLAPSLGIEPVVLRYFNTFGIRQAFTPYVGVITIFITRLLRKQPITIFGDGLQTRDFTHVSDIVAANLLALKKKEAAGGVFNIGSGRGTTVVELARLLRERLRPAAAVVHEPARPEELRYSVADITAAASQLGYVSKTDLSLQLQEVIDFLSRRQ
jgi:UDP-glucose 4-epimerase